MNKQPVLILIFLATILNSCSQEPPSELISYNGQELFLNGGNIAWVDFAKDLGPGELQLDAFEDMFRQVSEHGGNSMRMWLHTTGEHTPEWDGNKITGPGEGVIEDLRQILDLAWEHEVGMILCLWSFDMLRISNGPEVTDRAKALLESEELTNLYIENALIPMIEELGDHPAIISWEIFNEAEGMSEEFGWEETRHVPMKDIQRFVNLSAGAIHETNPEAQVTTGVWSLHALYPQSGHKNAENYYSDEALIEAGGHPEGILDFHTVHYYDWAGEKLSPFHHDKDHWGLDKPLVVAEFGIPEGDVYGVPGEDIYQVLYDRGYAGAMVWQWINWYDRQDDPGEWSQKWLRALPQIQDLTEKYPDRITIQK